MPMRSFYYHIIITRYYVMRKKYSHKRYYYFFSEYANELVALSAFPDAGRVASVRKGPTIYM